MERSRILGAGVWTAIGLTAAFAVVSANSNHLRATAAKTCKAGATVASAHDCCAQDVKAAPAVAAATKAAPKAAMKPSSKTAHAVAVNGLVVAIDPESGELGAPSAAQMAQLEAAQQLLPSDELSHSDAGLTPVRHPDGSVSLDLEGRFQEFATIHVGPGGKRIFGCSDRPTLDLPVSQFAPAALEEK